MITKDWRKYMTRFEIAYEEMRKWEGGFSDDKYDSGGATQWGISKRAHPRTFGLIMYLLEKGCTELAQRKAKNFYREHYWNNLYDEIPDSSLAFKLFDFGVNAGVKRAVKILQRTINKTNYFPGDCPLKIDGAFGRKTFAHICTRVDNGINLYEEYIKRLGRFYRKLKMFFRFGRGWMRRLNNRKYLERT